MPEITIDTECAEWTLKLNREYSYIFIKGGRMSGKSHGVAEYLVEESAGEADLKVLCLREVQKSIKHSSKTIIDDKIRRFGLKDYYKSVDSEIRKTHAQDGGLFLFQGMSDLTADSVKSLEGFKIAWFEEAQNMSAKSLKTLRPTIMRLDGAQMIFSWNPKFPDDPIEEFCSEMRGEPDVLIIHVNYNENPFLGEQSLNEIERDKRKFADDFEHIYLGGFDQSFMGHYYAKLITEMENEGRICEAPKKSGVDIITAWDLGRSDSTAIWVAQIVGLQPRVIDYYENNFEDLDHYAEWIKDNGYVKAKNFLPHDGGQERLGMKGSIRSQLKEMGLNDIKVLKSASKQSGVALAKSLLKECYIDKDNCKEGIRALKHFKTVYDEKTRLYKELHDWSSHGADAFRYLAHALEHNEPKPKPKPNDYYPQHHSSGSWMGA